MRRIITGIIVLAASISATLAVGPYYVRIGGGNLAACDGLTNVPLAGSTGGHCAWNKVSTASQNAARGSTVFVAGGSYTSDAIKPNQTPTQESERISFLCADDFGVACGDVGCAVACDITPAAGVNPLDLTSPARSYITVDGFTFHNGVAYGGAFSSKHNIIRNSRILDNANLVGVIFVVDGDDQLAENVQIERDQTKQSSPSIDLFSMGQGSTLSHRITFTNVSGRGGRNGGHIEWCADCVVDGLVLRDIYNHVLSIGENDPSACGSPRSVTNLIIKNSIFYATSDFGEPVPDVRSVQGFTFINNVTNNLQLPDANTPHCIAGLITVRNNAFVNYNTGSSGNHLGLNANQSGGGALAVFDIDYNAYIGTQAKSSASGNIQGTGTAWWTDTRNVTPFSAFSDPDSDGDYKDATASSDFLDWNAHGTNPDGSGFDEHSIVIANKDYRFNSLAMGARVWGKSAPTWGLITECVYGSAFLGRIDTRTNWANGLSANGDIVEFGEDGVVHSTTSIGVGNNPTGDCDNAVNFTPQFPSLAARPPVYTWGKSWGQQDGDGDGSANFSVVDTITPADRNGWVLVNGSPLIDGGDSAHCGRAPADIRGVACDIGPHETNQTQPTTLSVLPNVGFTEGANATSQYVLSVTLNQPAAADVTFDYTIASGTGTVGTACSALGTTDATLPTGLLTGSATIPTQTTSFPVVINVCDDSATESNETITITVSNVVGAQTANLSQTLTIIDNDALTPPTLTIGNVTQTESQVPPGFSTPTMVFTLTLSRTLGSAVTGSYSTSSSSATSGVTCTGSADFIFSSGTFTIPASTLTTTIAVPICDDATVESNEVFLLGLSGVSATVSGVVNNPATATILDNDSGGVPTVSIADRSVSEGDPSAQVVIPITMSQTATVIVTFARATSDVTATGGATCAAGVDYITPAVGPLLGINPGGTATSLTVTLCPDTLVEGNETFTVTLSSISSNATFLDAVATITIIDDDQANAPSGNLFYGATMYGINPVSQGPPPPPALALCGAAPEYGVTLLGSCTCSGTVVAGTSCFCGTIDGCSDGNGGVMPSLSWQIRVTPKSSACGAASGGTILWSPGLGDSAYSTDSTIAPDSDNDGTQDFRDTLLDLAASPNCFRSIETRYGPVNGQGWHDTGEPGVRVGVMRALSRPASLHRYLKEQFSQSAPGGFCMFGSSGGAAQAATNLSAYGESDVFDLVVLGSGPWNARMDLGCTATQASTLLGDGYPDPGSNYIDLSNGFAQGTGPCITAPACPGGIVDCLSYHLNDSLLGPFGIRFNFTATGQQTKVVMLRGLNDTASGAPAQQLRFWQAIANATYGGVAGALLPDIQEFTGATHDIAATSAVDAFLTTTMATDCVAR